MEIEDNVEAIFVRILLSEGISTTAVLDGRLKFSVSDERYD